MQNDKDIGHETRNSHLEQKEKMVTFGRTFKSPIHFARARRPGMPGRTLSNSSDMSATSVHEKSQLDAIAFPSTPLGENHTNPQGKISFWRLFFVGYLFSLCHTITESEPARTRNNALKSMPPEPWTSSSQGVFHRLGKNARVMLLSTSVTVQRT